MLLRIVSVKVETIKKLPQEHLDIIVGPVQLQKW